MTDIIDRSSPAAASGERILDVQTVSVAFDGVLALSEVDFHLREGEILGLIGPNGAGKTTLVNVLSGFQRPSPGRVRFRGQDVTGKPPYERARLGMVRTFQAGRLFPDLAVAENVEIAALGMRHSRRHARAIAARVLATTGLEAIASKPAAGLPHGYERLVGIARALATGATVLLLDEPAAGLNDGEGQRLVELLETVRRDLGHSIILIEHDMRIVMSLCDRVHALNYGKTIAVGTPAEIQEDQAVRDAYLGSSGEEASRDA